MDKKILTGQIETHLTKLPHSEKLVHKEIVADFIKLAAEAKKDGFDLQVISGFRSYEQQVNIWNRKALGKRALLDSDGHPLDYDKLKPKEIVAAIMRWSAIPGASRHHWGTEIDVFDGNGLEASQVQLTPQEVASDGPMGQLHLWLDERIQNNLSFGFFRPYEIDNGGVAPEKWHLSYAPVSNNYTQAYSLEVFKENIENSQIELKEILLKNLKYYYEQYVINICTSPF